MSKEPTEKKCCPRCLKVEGDYFDAVSYCQESDCPCHKEPKTPTDDFSERLQVEVMEDYIHDARWWRDDETRLSIMQNHFEKLAQFIQKEREAVIGDILELLGDVETLAAQFHAVYQGEARRQGDVRHAEYYDQLPENTKEFDRVLARYIHQQIRTIINHST